MDKIKILVVDSDESRLQTWKMLLGNEPDFSIVGVASNKTKALKFIKKQRVDLVLLDLNLGKHGESISLIKEINRNKAIKVIAIAAGPDEPLLAQALLAGAIDYCPKENFRDIPALIRWAHRHPAPVQILLKEYQKLQQELVSQKLSPAENEVFELLLKNCSLAKMGYQLNKAENTIKYQIHAVFKKLRVKTRRQVIENFSFNYVNPIYKYQ